MTTFLAVLIATVCSPFGALLTVSLAGALVFERFAQRREDPEHPRRRPPRRRHTSPHLARMNALTQIAQQKERQHG